MNHEKKQCDICPWPLECSPEMRADRPDGVDCPRDAHVWDRHLADSPVALAGAAPLEATVDDHDRHLVLV
jgi:hypothetical protein